MPRPNKAKRSGALKAKKMLMVMKARREGEWDAQPLERLKREAQGLKKQEENENTDSAQLSPSQDPGAEDLVTELSCAQSTSTQEHGDENISSAPLTPSQKPDAENRKRTLEETSKTRTERRGRKRKITIECPRDSKKQKKQKNTAKATTENKSEVNTFGIYVAEKLNQISTGQRVIAEKIIFNILFLAKTNYLDVNSRIQGLLTHSAFSSQTSQPPQYPSYAATSSTANPPVPIHSPLLSHTHHNPNPSALSHSQNTQPSSVLHIPTPDTTMQIIVKEEEEEGVKDNIFEDASI